MHRLIAILFVAWAVVGTPGLCAGGFLFHACLCADDTECGHEEQCSFDPCSTPAPAPAEGGHSVLPLPWAPAFQPAAALPACTAPPAATAARMRLAYEGLWVASPASPGGRLPHPLLI